jgi:hypothetical protein
MPNLTGLLFTLLSLIFAVLLWRCRKGSHSGPGTTELWIRTSIPPLMLLMCMPSGYAGNLADGFGTLRLNVTGVAVKTTSPAPPRARTGACGRSGPSDPSPAIIVGTSRECVDLLIDPHELPGIAGTLAQVSISAQGNAGMKLETVAGGGGAGIVAYDMEDGRHYVGSSAIADGFRLCLSRCDAPDAHWWIYRAGALAPDGRPGSAHPLQDAAVSPERSITRLSMLLCERGRDGACTGPLLAAADGPREAPRPALSFLFRNAGGWHVMLLDAGASLQDAQRRPVPTERIFTEDLAPGGARHVAVLALRQGRLSELRSFTVSNDAQPADARQVRHVRLALDTPEQISIGHCSRAPSGLATGSAASETETIALQSIGARPGSFLTAAAAAFPLSDWNLCRTTSHSFAAPMRPGADRQIEFRVDRLAMPALLLALAVACALIYHLASVGRWARDPLDGVLLSLLQYLLSLRAVIAIEGVFADPAIAWRQAYSEVGTAMIALPALLISVRALRDESPQSPLMLILFAIGAHGALWWWLGPPDWAGLFMAGAAVGALAIRALALRRRPGRSAEADALAAPSPARGGPLGGGLRLGLWLLLVAAVGRVLLRFLGGFRERLLGIPLSAIYLPMVLVGLATLLERAEKAAGRGRLLAGIGFSFAMLVTMAVVPLYLRDVGFALVFGPPIAAVALWRLRIWSAAPGVEARAGRAAKIVWSLPAAMIVGAFIAAGTYVAITPPPGPGAPVRMRVEAAVAPAYSDANRLRLRAVFAPSQIQRIGNSAAATQLEQSIKLEGFTDSFFGRGYLANANLGGFTHQAVHFSDYVSAVHVMAPFGRMGALALLLVLAAAAGAACSTSALAPPARWPALAGALAVWTLFGAGAYMILSNLQLVPFTGRNIYFLAVTSGGDLAEGMALLLLARLGLAVREQTA